MNEITKRIKEMERGDKIFYIGLISFFIIGSIIMHVFIYVTFVPSGSMLPTINEKSIIVADRTFDKNEIERGDIVFFEKQDQNKNLVKRVIALPGEKVRLEGSKLYVNKKELKEDYLYEMPQYDPLEVIVPEGHLFVMGDNRNNSLDSRYYGPVNKDTLIAIKKTNVFF